MRRARRPESRLLMRRRLSSWRWALGKQGTGHQRESNPGSGEWKLYAVCVERAQVQGVGGRTERAKVNMEMINLELKLKLECCPVPLFWKRDYVTQTGAGVRIWQAAAALTSRITVHTPYF